jgi:hypothetical protein
MYERVQAVRQVIVIPGRTEPFGSEFAGQALPGSPVSGLTYERAALAAQFAQENPEVEKVICVGGLPRKAALRRHVIQSPAEAVAQVLMGQGLAEGRISIHSKGRTARSQFEAALDSMMPEQPLGVVSHKKHWPRVRYYGNLVLPQTVLYPIFAD